MNAPASPPPPAAMKDELSAAKPSSEKMKVAVLDFDSGPTQAKEADVGKTVSDLVGKKLDSSGYAVIDRKQVDQALQARNLTNRQLDPSTAASFGRSLGADAVIVIAHMGHPWEDECVVLIRKHPNLYTNISALHYRPLRHYQALMTAIEYGVEHKLILGSDFPSATLAQVITGQRKVNDILEGTRFPRVSSEIIENIIYENWKRFLPEHDKT